jgi:formylglycine-generating enzyme required for sulfatase activity
LVSVRRDSIGQTVLERVQKWLVALLEIGTWAPPARAFAGNVLAQLGDPRFREDAWYLPDEPMLGFVEVPEGLFVMGSDKKKDTMAYEDEQPLREVMLPAYFVARYPVTHAQYLAFVESTGHSPPIAEVDSERPYEWRDGRPPSHLLNHPVVLVTWYDAEGYCRWLTEQLRDWEQTPAPLARLLREEGWQVALPTEAQWEKAARGTDGRIYPWGDEPHSIRANYDDAEVGRTSAVGCFPSGASPYGAEDMSGNVDEWCATKWQESYQDYRDDNDPAGDDLRVLRGGAFDFDQGLVRCAYRYGYFPDGQSDLIGFRVVVAPGS